MIKRKLVLLMSIVIMSALVGCAPSSALVNSEIAQSSTETMPTVESTTEETTIETEIETEATSDETTVETEESEETTVETTTEATTEATTATETTAKTYILNTNTKKIHSPNCSSVKTIKDKNKAETTKSIEELKNEGYEVCKNCNAK